MRFQPQVLFSMADPLSITASVLTVLQVAESLTNFIRDLKNASEEHKKVLSEVQSLQSVLHQVYESSRRTELEISHRGLFEGPQDALEICRLHLEDLMNKLAPMRQPGKTCSSVMWKFKKTAIKNTLADIERQKGTLMLALQNETRSVLT
jgi:hypothetical protein